MEAASRDHSVNYAHWWYKSYITKSWSTFYGQAALEITKFANLPSFLSQTTQPSPYPEKSSFANFFPIQHFLA